MLRLAPSTARLLAWACASAAISSLLTRSLMAASSRSAQGGVATHMTVIEDSSTVKARMVTVDWPEAWKHYRDVTSFFFLAAENVDVDLPKRTWAKAINPRNLHFVGNCPGCTIAHPRIPEGRQYSLVKTLFAFEETFKQAPWAEFVFRTDFDLLVVPENLFGWMASLGPMDGHNQHFYAGLWLNEFYQSGFVYPSGGGYIMSRYTHEKMRQAYNGTNGKCFGHEGNGVWEDAFIAGCLKLANITATHSILFNSDDRPLHKKRAWSLRPAIRPISFGYYWDVHPIHAITLHNLKNREDFIARHFALRQTLGHSAGATLTPADWEETLGPQVESSKYLELSLSESSWRTVISHIGFVLVGNNIDVEPRDALLAWGNYVPRGNLVVVERSALKQNLTALFERTKTRLHYWFIVRCCRTYVFPENVAGLIAAKTLSAKQPVVLKARHASTSDELLAGLILTADALQRVLAQPGETIGSWVPAGVLAKLTYTLSDQSVRQQSASGGWDAKRIARFPLSQVANLEDEDLFTHHFYARVSPALEEPLDWFEEIATRPLYDSNPGDAKYDPKRFDQVKWPLRHPQRLGL